MTLKSGGETKKRAKKGKPRERWRMSEKNGEKWEERKNETEERKNGRKERKNKREERKKARNSREVERMGLNERERKRVREATRRGSVFFAGYRSCTVEAPSRATESLWRRTPRN